MTYELIAALMAFAFVSSITPGPNNLMLMASGANFGFQRTLPHMLGVALGFSFMVILVGIGLMELFERLPASYEVLKVASITYLLYLAFKIARAAEPIKDEKSKAKPFTFLQAALFQWVNPKAWTMALTAITVYAPSQSLIAVSVVAGIFGLVNLPSVSAWALMGQTVRRYLNSTLRLKMFNWSMASLLIASLYPVLQI